MVDATARAVLDEARRRGISLTVDRDGILANYRQGTPTEDLKELVPLFRQELIALLSAEDEEVAWRVLVMRGQLPDRGPIPFLLAKPEVRANDAPGCCLSCGEPLTAERRFRCLFCTAAVQRLLEELEE
jgi:hypothetical protein